MGSQQRVGHFPGNGRAVFLFLSSPYYSKALMRAAATAKGAVATAERAAAISKVRKLGMPHSLGCMVGRNPLCMCHDEWMCIEAQV